jgi:hypothetical protein
MRAYIEICTHDWRKRVDSHRRTHRWVRATCECAQGVILAHVVDDQRHDHVLGKAPREALQVAREPAPAPMCVRVCVCVHAPQSFVTTHACVTRVVYV